MNWPYKDLLGTRELSKDDILLILDTAESFKEISRREIKKVPTLRGKTIITAFYEPSTRTRVSFEIAAKRLSADTISISGTTSSAVKGETLKDTGRNLESMRPDVIVIRHSMPGAPHILAKALTSSIINGGDIAHSRVARSNIFAMKKFDMDVTCCAPPTMIPPYLEDLGVNVEYRLDKAVADRDVIMMLRIQKERGGVSFIPSIKEYAMLYSLKEEHLQKAKKDVIIMHPGPMNRGVEISDAVADGPYSVILDQVENGVAVRMGILFLLLGGES
jgi:aspartate carbamoyltransferase catalytic subunit